MFAPRVISTPLVLGLISSAALAHAETEKGDVGAVAASEAAAPPGDLALKEDIVVTAHRYGEANVAAESELGEGEIASHGANSIQDLLSRLAPLIDPRGEEPAILINGKPAGFDGSIFAYPPEALDRLIILKPEAAAQYGERPGKRVVNLVLKKKFAMLNADAGMELATAGGQYGGSLSVGRTAISGPVRWNVQARISRDSALRKNARNIPPRTGAFDRIGYISGVDGGEISPALTAAVGTRVTVAAIPPGAPSGTPALMDFAATADDLYPVDPNAFETLQSSRRNMSLGIGVTRPVGAFTASLNLNASRNDSNGLRGLPMTSAVIPVGNSWSPFAGDIVLTRPFAGARPLRENNNSKSLGGSLTLNGMIEGWQTSLGVSYSRNWSNNLFETGIDAGRVQQLIDADDPAFNPYGVWDASLLLSSRNRTQSGNLSGRVQVQKNIVDLPAGPISVSFLGNTSRSRSESRQSDNRGGPAEVNPTAREQFDGQMSVTIPISRRAGETGIWPLGDIAVDLSLSGQKMSNNPLRKRLGGGVNWSPISAVQFRGSLDYIETAPSFEQLDGPVITTANRIFDYTRGEIVEPLWITGGNPDLGRGSRQSLALSATVRPFDNQALSLNVDYRQAVAKGAISSFPELTPVIEAAFPERVTRDAAGRLVAVDARAINIARSTDTGLSSGIALRLPTQDGARAGWGAMPADPLQFSISLNHSMRLKSELQTRAGLPAIDQLADSGQPRHNVSLQATAGKRGIGASLNGNWSSAARVSNADRIFRFKPPMIFNLSMFVEPGRLFDTMKKVAVADNLKISLDIQNLFNGYRRVTLDDGSTPAGYSRDEIDPLGRTVRLTLRKRF